MIMGEQDAQGRAAGSISYIEMPHNFLIRGMTGCRTILLDKQNVEIYGA